MNAILTRSKKQFVATFRPLNLQARGRTEIGARRNLRLAVQRYLREAPTRRIWTGGRRLGVTGIASDNRCDGPSTHRQSAVNSLEAPTTELAHGQDEGGLRACLGCLEVQAGARPAVIRA